MRLPSPADPGDRERVTGSVDPLLAVLDLEALDANADKLVRRAAGKPVRVASRSVRNRGVLRRVLARPGFADVLAYWLREARVRVDHRQVVGRAGVAASHMPMINYRVPSTQRARCTRVSSKTGSADS